MYDVLDTDYDKYTIVYSKFDGILFGLFSFEYAWVLSREPHTKNSEGRKEIYQKAKRVLETAVQGFNFDSSMYSVLQGSDLPNIVYDDKDAPKEMLRDLPQPADFDAAVKPAKA